MPESLNADKIVALLGAPERKVFGDVYSKRSEA
jgi:hypothetical protein